jgi:hypothetical protein
VPSNSVSIWRSGGFSLSSSAWQMRHVLSRGIPGSSSDSAPEWQSVHSMSSSTCAAWLNAHSRCTVFSPPNSTQPASDAAMAATATRPA